MKEIIFSVATDSRAIRTASEILANTYTLLPYPAKEATYLLFGVPSLDADGSILGGGSLEDVLEAVSGDVTIIGGNLRHPKLTAYQTIDLLEDPFYLAKNAGITAYCALRYALTELPITLDGCSVLILGWGRIAKCLAFLLGQLHADVTIAARKEADRAMAEALGFHAVKIPAVEETDYRLIYNTIPHMVLPQGNGGAVKIDLASTPGMEGSDVISGRGLPGKYAPESSGKLIAETIIRLVSKKEEPL